MIPLQCMKKNSKKWLNRIIGAVVVLIAIDMLLPADIQNPDEGCGMESYNSQSFWHPWGNHKHHGVDIFAPKGTVIHSAIGGIVVAEMHTNGADSRNASLLCQPY